MSTYGDSTSRYLAQPTFITQSRESSVESRSSSGRSSTDGNYTSSRNTMGSSRVEERQQRVPDNVRHSITTKTRGKVMVVQHDKAIYDHGAPLASDAKYEDYKRTEERQRRREKEQKGRASGA